MHSGKKGGGRYKWDGEEEEEEKSLFIIAILLRPPFAKCVSDVVVFHPLFSFLRHFLADASLVGLFTRPCHVAKKITKW